jgi:serine/threonine protein phosphatase PrpC
VSAEALHDSFLSFDRWWADARCDPALSGGVGWDESGSTALVGLLAGSCLTVGNAGDGAALLARGGRALRLSEEVRRAAGAALR